MSRREDRSLNTWNWSQRTSRLVSGGLAKGASFGGTRFGLVGYLNGAGPMRAAFEDNERC